MRLEFFGWCCEAAGFPALALIAFAYIGNEVRVRTVLEAAKPAIHKRFCDAIQQMNLHKSQLCLHFLFRCPLLLTFEKIQPSTFV